MLPQGADILGRSVKTGTYRYNEWSNSRADRELYLSGQPLGDCDNLAGHIDTAAQQREGEQLLHDSKQPKPGPAERPRALLKSGKPEKKKENPPMNVSGRSPSFQQTAGSGRIDPAKGNRAVHFTREEESTKS